MFSASVVMCIHGRATNSNGMASVVVCFHGCAPSLNAVYLHYQSFFPRTCYYQLDWHVAKEIKAGLFLGLQDVVVCS